MTNKDGCVSSSEQNMKARYELSRRIAHDTKAPIRQIAQLIEIFLAENAGSLDEDALAILGMVQDKTRHLADVTQAVRDYSDAMCKPLAPQDVDFTAVLAAEIESLQFETVLFKSESPISMVADPQFLRQFIQRLLKSISFAIAKDQVAELVISVCRDEVVPAHIRLDCSPCSIDFPEKLQLIEFAQYKSGDLFELLSLHECSEICLRHGWGLYMETTGEDVLRVNICL
ncbi:hypothetical protein [uncultured Cohaesibacter sp.]|uniref:hypothetical protein n=1 Tax=uncultured Cohaesibacter sp. TaxID=1002546 RepID=UPI002AABE9C4|nr:hypothetical protein [uncultured Cohaesibacter sp.]